MALRLAGEAVRLRVQVEKAGLAGAIRWTLLSVQPATGGTVPGAARALQAPEIAGRALLLPGDLVESGSARAGWRILIAVVARVTAQALRRLSVLAGQAPSGAPAAIRIYSVILEPVYCVKC